MQHIGINLADKCSDFCGRVSMLASFQKEHCFIGFKPSTGSKCMVQKKRSKNAHSLVWSVMCCVAPHGFFSRSIANAGGSSVGRSCWLCWLEGCGQEGGQSSHHLLPSEEMGKLQRYALHILSLAVSRFFQQVSVWLRLFLLPCLRQNSSSELSHSSLFPFFLPPSSDLVKRQENYILQVSATDQCSFLASSSQKILTIR